MDNKLTIDRALPQDFYDRVAREPDCDHPWSWFVWAYPEGLAFGLPCPQTDGARTWCETNRVVYFDSEENLIQGL